MEREATNSKATPNSVSFLKFILFSSYFRVDFLPLGPNAFGEDPGAQMKSALQPIPCRLRLRDDSHLLLLRPYDLIAAYACTQNSKFNAK